MLSHLAGPVLACRELWSAAPGGRRGSLRLRSPGGDKGGAVPVSRDTDRQVDWGECQSEVTQDRARLWLSNPPYRRSISALVLLVSAAGHMIIGSADSRSRRNRPWHPAVGAVLGPARPRWLASVRCGYVGCLGRLALSHRAGPLVGPTALGESAVGCSDQSVLSGRAGLHARLSTCRDSVSRARVPASPDWDAGPSGVVAGIRIGCAGGHARCVAYQLVGEVEPDVHANVDRHRCAGEE